MPSPNKLTDRDENPVDRLLLKLSMDSLPFWYRTGHTANTLTTYKCIFGLLAWYNLRMRRVLWFGGFAIISYFFDCADGQMARTYGMVSNFGDRYDHGTDIILIGLYLHAFHTNYKGQKTYGVIVAILSVALILTMMALGCQQRLKPGDTHETLDHLKILCHNVSLTQYWGTGPLLLLFICIVAWMEQIPPERTDGGSKPKMNAGQPQ